MSSKVVTPSLCTALRFVAVVGAAFAAFLAFAATGAFANAGNPDSTQAHWRFVNGCSDNTTCTGPVQVWVTGQWDWGPGDGSQACTGNPVQGYNDVNGHWALGLAVDWGDSTVAPTNWKTPNGQVFKARTDSQMDWLDPNYCATQQNGYPRANYDTSDSSKYDSSGTYGAHQPGSDPRYHTYDSLQAFMQDTNNGQICANVYDVHQQKSDEEDPQKNGDNTLSGGHYPPTSAVCSRAVEENPAGCPSGQTMNSNGDCVSPTPSTPNCTGGQTYNSTDKACECPSGQQMQAGTCQPTPQPQANCPQGSSMQNGQCVYPANCPSGTTMQNGTCVYPSQCPSGTIMQGTNCVYPSQCPQGTTMTSSGQCVYPSTPQGCPSGTQMQGNQCVTPPTCPSGTQMQGNQCVAPTVCPSGTQMQAGTCVAPATVAEKPAITISKTERDASVGGGFVSGPINVRVGDTIGYQIVVTNTGNDNLLVHLTDPGCQINASGTTIDFSNLHMRPGQALTFHCWHVMTNADAPVYTNTATANGVSASASGSVNGSASVNASSSTSASPLSTGPVSSSVVANAPKVLAAKHTVTKATPKKVAQPKVIVKVVHVVTKPAPKVVKAASFTG